MFVDEADFETIQAVCATLCAGGVVLGDQGRSVGPYTPAVPAEHSWAVLGLRGNPIFLAHDAFEVARAFCRLEAWLDQEEDVHPGFTFTDAYLVEVSRWESWSYQYRFAPVGDPHYDPPFPTPRAEVA